MLKFTAPQLFPLIKKLKITNATLSKEMGYSAVYISYVLNGHNIGSEKFHRLLVAAIAKKSKKDYGELSKLLNGTEWESYLP